MLPPDAQALDLQILRCEQALSNVQGGPTSREGYPASVLVELSLREFAVQNELIQSPILDAASALLLVARMSSACAESSRHNLSLGEYLRGVSPRS